MAVIYEAIWAFREEILDLRKKLGEELETHASHPLGMPLHKYEGQLSLENERLSLVGKNKDSLEEFRLYVRFKEISGVYFGWDDVVRRWKDTRGLMKPLRVTFGNQGKKILYIYARKVGAKIYGKENKTLAENAWALKLNEVDLNKNAKIALHKVTGKTVRAICSLSVSEEQKKFVAPNAVSIAQAYFAKSAWFRAIYADDTPVGFVMLTEIPKRGERYLWRFMIDVKHQGKGYGRRTLELVIKHVKKDPKAKALTLSVVRGEGSAENLYRSFGFEFTGEMEGIEHVMKLNLKEL